MSTNKFLLIIFLSIFLNSCASRLEPLKEPTVVVNETILKYKYIYVSPTQTLTSSNGAVSGNVYGTHGTTHSKSVNPKDAITGILLKKGFISLTELKPELSNETLIVNYGESGRRNRGKGYTIEVTIQFISANSNSIISTCTAEGQGETEVDDIRIAINRCLSGLLEK